MYGAQGNDFLRGGRGNDTIDGGRGLNHSIYSGTHTEYLVARINDQVIEISDQVLDRDGTDSLIRVQRAQFSNFQ
jgi:Ca2+-binding RTX toxin-like protein